jgi:F-type H+-transporting ATPase subunit b
MFESPEFWVAVGFVLLVIGIARPISKMMGSALDARADKIRATLQEAEKLREDAQRLLAEYERKTRDVMRESEDIIAQARAAAERMAVEAEASLATAMKRREQLAIEKIAQAEAEALQEVRTAAVDIAVAAAGRLIGERLGAERSGALIDAAIREVPAKLGVRH